MKNRKPRPPEPPELMDHWLGSLLVIAICIGWLLLH